MKTYTIGRDLNCDIVINDSTDVISRKHATLVVDDSGKMSISDSSSNGTYINGIRITPNTPVPVTRKDTVSLAHVAKLDWALIPEHNGSKMKWIIGAIVLVAVVAAAVILLSDGKDPKGSAEVCDSTEIKAVTDTIMVADTVVAPADTVVAKTDSVGVKADETAGNIPTDKKSDRKDTKKEDKKSSDKKDSDKKDVTKEPQDTMKSRRPIG